MRAVQITRFGDPEVLDVVDLPDPVAGSGEQLFDISSSGVTYELQRRLAVHGTTTVAAAAHPGVSNTELVRNSPTVVRVLMDRLAPFVTQPAVLGALPTLRAATDPAVLGGQYYGPAAAARSAGTPGSSRPAPSRTTSRCSSGCGPSPRTSRGWSSPSEPGSTAA
jgi:hypothetical protein